MGLDIESPEEIYVSISSRVKGILQSLQGDTDDPDVLAAKEKTVSILRQFQGKLNERMSLLQQHADWEMFTIAFYGETNAGKSTIVEMLRIMLSEEGKLAERQRFHEHLAAFRNLETQRQALGEAFAQSEALWSRLAAEQTELEQKHIEQQQRFENERAVLERSIAERRNNASLWRRLVNLLVRLPEEKQSVALATEAATSRARSEREAGALQRQQQDAFDKKTVAEQQLRQAEARAQEGYAALQKFADGGIIGNGQSDFTVQSQAYHCAVNGQKFALLDVPGIEGKEQAVSDNIWAAVNKAHAVFYVTSKPTPPQTGEGNQKGTLEKIREHLGAQTEVWTIYNKRITNPIQFKTGRLISKDEQASLAELDEKVREHLGENYREVITLSAQPGFLAVAECLVPASVQAKSRAKFMSEYDAVDLLRKSKVKDFYRLLSRDLVNDHAAKIIKSNYNKANQLVKDLAGNIDELLNRTFKPLGKKLAADADSAQSQIDTAGRALRTRLQSQGEKALNDFSHCARKKIYDKIDGDISNDEFKTALERVIRSEQERLVKGLPASMDGELRKFQSDIAETVEMFREHAADLTAAYGSVRLNELGGELNLHMKLDNGINVKGLLGAAVGAVVLALNPTTWPLLALGAITIIVGSLKAVWGFFSSDYKKSQQRNSANDNLERITAALRASLRDSLDAALPQLQQKVDLLKQRVEAPVREIAEMSAMLKKSRTGLNKLIKTLEKAGAM